MKTYLSSTLNFVPGHQFVKYITVLITIMAKQKKTGTNREKSVNSIERVGHLSKKFKRVNLDDCDKLIVIHAGSKEGLIQNVSLVC